MVIKNIRKIQSNTLIPSYRQNTNNTHQCVTKYAKYWLQREMRRLLVSSPGDIHLWCRPTNELSHQVDSWHHIDSTDVPSPFQHHVTSLETSFVTNTDTEEYSLYERPLQADTPAQNHADICVDTLVVSSTAFSCDHQYNDYSPVSSR